MACVPSSSAETRFDVFLGYDGFVRESEWFPVTLELFNDGAGFDAVVEISSGSFGSEEKHYIPVELPSNTQKRIIVPVFAGASRGSSWDFRLLDEREKLQAEQINVRARFAVPWEGILLGALPGSFGGLPSFPEMKGGRNEMEPKVARLQADHFPDNPIGYEGLSTIYLNSQKALDLRVEQIAALLGWIHTGGHLIVAVDQPGDVNSTPWLRELIPARLEGTVNRSINEPISRWIQEGIESERINGLTEVKRYRPVGNATANSYEQVRTGPALESLEVPVTTGVPVLGEVILSAGGAPLIISGARGRGEVTVLLFSPEREPLRSWAQRGWFWARLIEAPGELFSGQSQYLYGGWNIDAAFGALLDSRQVQSLPVQWLLILLVVYLIVIGPFDRWWLKKINRQMLTWITFPTYVALFSLLIYFIGYKLRAGDTEWNELQVVDVLPRGESAELRGRTYFSVYSSANARYDVASEQPFAALRSEGGSFQGGSQGGGRTRVVHEASHYSGEIFVPVWTSLLYVSEWMQPGARPVEVTVTDRGGEWEVKLINVSGRLLSSVHVVVGGRLFEGPDLAPEEEKVISLSKSGGAYLDGWVGQHLDRFITAVEQRRSPLGAKSNLRLEDPAETAIVTSFASQLGSRHESQRGFIYPESFDLAEQVARGHAVIFALDEDRGVAPPIHKFTPPRMNKDSVYRIVVPVRQESKSAAVEQSVPVGG